MFLPERETVAIKKIELITPPFASRYGIQVDRPVFISSTDSREIRPVTYEVGKIIQTDLLPKDHEKGFTSVKEIEEGIAVVSSRPMFGFGYDEVPRRVMTNGSLYWSDIRGHGWVAIIEPLGEVIKHDDYLFAYNRITDKFRVKEILAYCRESSCRDLPPLNEGLVTGPWGEGIYVPACSTKKHPDANEMDHFNFRMLHDGAQPLFEGF